MSAVDLYEHQREAVNKMRSGSVLVGGVGTGKSRTALAYYFEKELGGRIGSTSRSWQPPQIDMPLYIITTARKRDTLEWEQEALPFHIKDMTVDSWNNIKKYVDVKDSFFIFDEQRIIGNGVWVKSFLKIAKNNRWVLLTATPGDSWIDYCPVFIANGFYKNRTEFIRKHVVYSAFSKFPKIERYVGTAVLEYCRKQIVIPMTYEKRTVKHENWVKVGYDEETYNQIERTQWDIYKDEPVESVPQYLYCLRKLVNSSELRLMCTYRLAKKHHKTIIFYNFDYELDLLRQMFTKTGIPFSEWNGHRHEPILVDEKSWVYLVQYAAGAEGWNCIETDTIIFYSQNYSYRTTIQAAGRVDRMNTPFNELYIYHIFSDSKIDKAIHKCYQGKKTFNEKMYAKKENIDFSNKSEFVQLSMNL